MDLQLDPCKRLEQPLLDIVDMPVTLETIPLFSKTPLKESKATKLSYLVAHLLSKAYSNAVNESFRRGVLRYADMARHNLVQPGGTAGRAILPHASTNTLMSALHYGQQGHTVPILSGAAFPAASIRCARERWPHLALFEVSGMKILFNSPVIEGAAEVGPAGVLRTIKRHNELIHGEEVGRRWSRRVASVQQKSGYIILYPKSISSAISSRAIYRTVQLQV